MRLFFAVPVGEAGAGGERAGPIEHLTLQFLGEVAPAIVPALVQEVGPVVARHPRFAISLEGLGAFPSRERPRVVWLAVDVGREALLRLATDLRAATARAGAPPERAPFVPHLTLFRVRSESDRQRARELLRGDVPPPAPRHVEVVTVGLVESRLGVGRTEHRVLESFPLAPG